MRAAAAHRDRGTLGSAAARWERALELADPDGEDALAIREDLAELRALAGDVDAALTLGAGALTQRRARADSPGPGAAAWSSPWAGRSSWPGATRGAHLRDARRGDRPRVRPARARRCSTPRSRSRQGSPARACAQARAALEDPELPTETCCEAHEVLGRAARLADLAPPSASSRRSRPGDATRPGLVGGARAGRAGHAGPARLDAHRPARTGPPGGGRNRVPRHRGGRRVPHRRGARRQGPGRGRPGGGAAGGAARPPPRLVDPRPRPAHRGPQPRPRARRRRDGGRAGPGHGRSAGRSRGAGRELGAGAGDARPARRRRRRGTRGAGQRGRGAARGAGPPFPALGPVGAAARGRRVSTPSGEAAREAAQRPGRGAPASTGRCWRSPGRSGPAAPTPRRRAPPTGRASRTCPATSTPTGWSTSWAGSSRPRRTGTAGASRSARCSRRCAGSPTTTALHSRPRAAPGCASSADRCRAAAAAARACPRRWPPAG